ncbi:MAG: acetate/propionate family kinase [Pseudomonadota bacterium]
MRNHTAPAKPSCILAINGGSSTLRFALYQVGDPPQLLLRGKADRIGRGGSSWIVRDVNGAILEEGSLAASDHDATVNYLLSWLAARPEFATVRMVAHRIVHGMNHRNPELITPALLEHLGSIVAIDPEHLPWEIALIKAFQKRHSSLPQLACFDTAFHSTLAQIARQLPIPRRLSAIGIERYGFHGLSYAFCMRELVRLGDPAAASGRVILAHLGSGASLAAVLHGQSIDTSMGFTPAAGLMMGTRSGDLDPGLGDYLATTQGMSSSQFRHMVNHESGLLGVSGISSDMRDLLACAADHPDAAQAVAMFCYQVKKWIGAYSAALGGVDTLVFSGGIGENAPQVRERICAGLEFIGIELDVSRNARSAAVISSDSGRVAVRVIPTDEELELACSALPFCNPSEHPDGER